MWLAAMQVGNDKLKELVTKAQAAEGHTEHGTLLEEACQLATDQSRLAASLHALQGRWVISRLQQPDHRRRHGC